MDHNHWMTWRAAGQNFQEIAAAGSQHKTMGGNLLPIRREVAVTQRAGVQENSERGYKVGLVSAPA